MLDISDDTDYDAPQWTDTVLFWYDNLDWYPDDRWYRIDDDDDGSDDDY